MNDEMKRFLLSLAAFLAATASLLAQRSDVLSVKSYVLDMTFSSGEQFMYIIKGAKESAIEAGNVIVKAFVH